MKHKHFPVIESTQRYLEDHFAHLEGQSESLLVSCDKQELGHGRMMRGWVDFTHNLAFSFSLKPHPVKSLTSLEMAVLLARFWEENYQLSLSLKWPNDLLNSERQKVGGLILKSTGEWVLVGHGLNLAPDASDPHPTDFEYGYLWESLPPMTDFKKSMPWRMVQFILEHRLNSEQVIEQWTMRCAHHKEWVILKEGEEEKLGQFKGINLDGAALLDIEGRERSFFTGSLILQAF